jgi:hypothetical protein
MRGVFIRYDTTECDTIDTVENYENLNSTTWIILAAVVVGILLFAGVWWWWAKSRNPQGQAPIPSSSFTPVETKASQMLAPESEKIVQIRLDDVPIVPGSGRYDQLRPPSNEWSDSDQTQKSTTKVSTKSNRAKNRELRSRKSHSRK